MEFKKVIVHEFQVSDVEDPVLYAAQPLYEWEHSEQGQWVMTHAVEKPMWHRLHIVDSYYNKFIIEAKFTDKDYTFWQLKWGSKP